MAGCPVAVVYWPQPLQPVFELVCVYGERHAGMDQLLPFDRPASEQKLHGLIVVRYEHLPFAGEASRDEVRLAMFPPENRGRPLRPDSAVALCPRRWNLSAA